MTSHVTVIIISSDRPAVVRKVRIPRQAPSRHLPTMMSSDATIPQSMKRLVVTSPGNGTSVADCTLQVESVPTPTPKSGEVLIKVVAAPINPSDYGSWFQSSASAYPMPIGKEGCGIVVASGWGLSASYRFPVGTKVGFICKDSTCGGSYSEYVAVDATTSVFAMPEHVPIEDCASFFVNPYTAVGIIDTAKRSTYNNKKGSSSSSKVAIVHTAAASQLGQMLIKLARIYDDVEIINVVRRQEQKELLEQLGAKHIILTSGDTEAWKSELKAKVKELGATCAFDAVSGEMTGHLMDCMPHKGIVYIYGSLSGNINGINPLDLIYRKKQLKSFFLSSWIQEGGWMSMIPRMMSANKLVNSGLDYPDGWCCSQFHDTTMEGAHDEVLSLLRSGVTGKKLRIRI